MFSGKVNKLLLSIVFITMTGCAVYQPADPENICHIFQGETDWYEAALDAQKKWHIPIPVMMAIMHQESRFNANAEADREWFLWVIPLPLKSTAYGYAQAQNQAWDEYTADGHAFDVRDDFADAINFIGWYMDGSSQVLGIKKSDIYSQYLAYHEGRGGFKRKTYQRKPWLKKVASKVKKQSQRYQRQFKSCQSGLNEAISGWSYRIYGHLAQISYHL